MKIRRFERARHVYFANRMVQVVLFICASVLTFLWVCKALPIWDVSENAEHSLTPETVAYLQSLPTEVELIGSLALSEPSSLGRMHFGVLETLIRRYQRVTPKLKVRWVDGFRARSEYGFSDPYQILLRSADRNEWIGVDELWMSGSDSESFAGERVLTSALWRVSSPTKRRVIVYAAQDRLHARGLSGFSLLVDHLQQQGLDVIFSDQNLSGLSRADMVLLLGGLEYLDSADLASLQRYINDIGGSVLITLDQKPSEDFARFLYFNGIELGAYRVKQELPGKTTPLGESLISNFGESPVSQVLEQNNQTLLSRGQWWILNARAGAIDRQIEPMVLLEDAVREQTESVALSFLKKRHDAIAQKGIVLGQSDILSNAYFNYGGNQALLDASVDWLLGRDTFQTIPLRTLQAKQLSLSVIDFWKIGAMVIGCSLVLAIVGVLRLITRPR